MIILDFGMYWFSRLLALSLAYLHGTEELKKYDQLVEKYELHICMRKIFIESSIEKSKPSNFDIYTFFY